MDLYGWQTFLQLAVEFIEQVNNLDHVKESVCAMKIITETLYMLAELLNRVASRFSGDKSMFSLVSWHVCITEHGPGRPL